MSWNQNVSQRVRLTVEANGWPLRLGISFAMAGFLALMALISFPLPWTPVPFSMMPFALLVAGATQRPMYAALSVFIYLAAAGLGAPIFAGGASGWQHFVGATAGYLLGFVVVSSLVSRYMQKHRVPLPSGWAMAVVSVIGAGMVAGIAAIIWMWATGNGLTHLDNDVAATWGVGRSSLWALLFVTAAATGLALFLLGRARHERREALNLFMVMMGCILVLHAFGITVLWLVGGFSFMAALILGSVVFLPFDIVKAGLGVALTLPFMPSPPAEEHHA